MTPFTFGYTSWPSKWLHLHLDIEVDHSNKEIASMTYNHPNIIQYPKSEGKVLALITPHSGGGWKRVKQATSSDGWSTDSPHKEIQLKNSLETNNILSSLCSAYCTNICGGGWKRVKQAPFSDGRRSALALSCTIRDWQITTVCQGKCSQNIW